MGVQPASVRASVSACVRACVNTFKHEYLHHHWGGGKAAICFWPDKIGTLVSMATDSSHRVIMGVNIKNLLF